jgi:two-component system, OmpR family, phosphate regulon sensor histidine kinase PhoR
MADEPIIATAPPQTETASALHRARAALVGYVGTDRAAILSLVGLITAGLMALLNGPHWLLFISLGVGLAGVALIGIDTVARRVRAVAPLTPASAPAPAAPVWPALLNGLTDPALVVDGLGHLIGSNAPARALMSVAAGRHVSHTARSPELLDAIATTLRTRQPVTCAPRLLASADRAFTALVSPLSKSNALSEPAALVLIRDLTEQERLSRLRADFVANASHELRTPLTALARLIDDLLSLSRIEMNEHVTPQGRVEVAPLVGEVVRSLSKVAADAGIAVTFDETALSASVIGDRDELLQVAQNLIENGIKYGRRGGTVTISLDQRGGKLGLAVADDGIGIAPEHLPRLVERFYRVNATASRERGGTGLGLAIVKHITARHGGQLDIRSTLGQGSTFTVWLPIAVPSQIVTKV